MTRQLWAPWRLEYIKTPDKQDGCVFCRAAAGDDEDGLVLHRGRLAYALLNRYPYASGHLLIAPFRHVGDYGALTDDEAVEIHRLTQAALVTLQAELAAQGHNVGWNLGRVAGGSVQDHLHLHVVPRWTGDTNFMPVLADVKVMPEHLAATRRRLAAAWPV